MISHRHRFIFVHVPRTGGCSVEQAFGVDLAFSNPEDPRDDFRHLSPADYRERFPEEFGAYFKFAFVRNPWDRAVSIYTKLREKRAAALAEAEAAVSAATTPEGARKAERRLERVRTSQAADIAATLPFRDFCLAYDFQPQAVDGMDFVGRFETLGRDFSAACERIGVSRDLPHVNAAERGDYRRYYDSETRDRIARHCASEIGRFGYRFD